MKLFNSLTEHTIGFYLLLLLHVQLLVFFSFLEPLAVCLRSYSATNYPCYLPEYVSDTFVQLCSVKQCLIPTFPYTVTIPSLAYQTFHFLLLCFHRFVTSRTDQRTPYTTTNYLHSCDGRNHMYNDHHMNVNIDRYGTACTPSHPPTQCSTSSVSFACTQITTQRECSLNKSL